jgi:hypothetical protein
MLYMGVKLWLLMLKEEVTYKVLSRTSGPREIREWGKLKNREVTYFLLFTNITGDLLCKTRRMGHVAHMGEIRHA